MWTFTHPATSQTTALYNWYNYSDCYSNDWLYLSNYDQWTIMPLKTSSISDSDSVFLIGEGGAVYRSPSNLNNMTCPVIHLKSTIKISGGTGTSSYPYLLKQN